MRQRILLLCLLIAMLLPCNAQTTDKLSDPDKLYLAKLEELIEVSGNKETLDGQFPLMMQMLRSMLVNVPEDVIEALEKKFKIVFLDNYMKLVFPVYQKYYSLSDIEEYIQFYHTPIGKKVAKSLPLLAKDLAAVGQKAGQMIASSILQDLKQQGYNIKDM